MKITKATYNDDGHFVDGVLVERLFRRPLFFFLDKHCGWDSQVITKSNKENLVKRSWDDYNKELFILLDMYRCCASHRDIQSASLNEHDYQFYDNRSLEIRALFLKYKERLYNECLENTGRSLDDVPTDDGKRITYRNYKR